MSNRFPKASSPDNHESNLVHGNLAFMRGNYQEAVRLYLKALADNAAIGHLISLNLALARNRYRALATKTQSVMIFGVSSPDDKKCPRLETFRKHYGSFCEVSVVDSVRPGMEDPEEVVNHPCDIVHFLGVHPSYLTLAALYKLIWNAAVFVDIHRNPQADFEFGLLGEFDAVSVSDSSLQQRYGGSVVQDDMSGRDLWMNVVLHAARKQPRELLGLLRFPPGSGYVHLLQLSPPPIMPTVLGRRIAVKDTGVVPEAIQKHVSSVRQGDDIPSRHASNATLSDQLPDKVSRIIDWQYEVLRPRRKGLVSIVMPVIRAQKNTLLCIEALFQFTPIDMFELVVVLCTDDTALRQQLKILAAQHSGVSLVFADASRTPAEQCNDGFLASRGEFVLLMQQDIMVRGGWLEPLIEALADPVVSVVQPWVLDSENKVVDIGTVFSSKNPGGYRIYAHRKADELSFVAERAFQAVSGYCMAVRAQDFCFNDGFGMSLGSVASAIDLSLRLSRGSGRCCRSIRSSLVTCLQQSAPDDWVSESDRTWLSSWSGKIEFDDQKYYNIDGYDLTGWKSQPGDGAETALPVLMKRPNQRKRYAAFQNKIPDSHKIASAPRAVTKCWQYLLCAGNTPIGLVTRIVSGKGAPSASKYAETLCLFLELNGVDPAKAVHLKGAAGEERRHVASACGADIQAAVTLKSPIGGLAAVTDAWYCTDFCIRFRLQIATTGGVAASQGMLRIHQYDPEAGLLRPCAEHQVLAGSAVLIDSPLINPLLPLLVTLTNGDGELTDIRLLPFPSLLRGGIHYSELFFDSSGLDYLHDFSRYSVKLLDDWMASHSAVKTAQVMTLELDYRFADGSECLFSQSVRTWLRQLFGISPRLWADTPAVVTPNETRDYLSSILATGQPVSRADAMMSTEACNLSLVLPPHSIPTLRALVAGIQDLAGPVQSQRASLLVAGAVDRGPLYLLELPESDPRLVEPVFPGAPNEFPLLLSGGQSRSSASASAVNPVYPLAIVFRDVGISTKASRLYPVAIDAPAKAVTHDDVSVARLAVILQFSSTLNQLENALIGLKCQQLVAIRSIVVICADRTLQNDKAILEMVHKHVACDVIVDREGKYRGENASVAFAKSAKCEYILFMDDSVVTHDPRTLRVLSQVCNSDKVATAACHLIKAPADGSDRFLLGTAGFLPGANMDVIHCDDAAIGSLTRSGVLDGMTYPVAANSNLLFMIRVTVLSKLGNVEGAGKTKAKAAGGKPGTLEEFAHVCTGAITALWLPLSPESSAAKPCWLPPSPRHSLRIGTSQPGRVEK